MSNSTYLDEPWTSCSKKKTLIIDGNTWLSICHNFLKTKYRQETMRWYSCLHSTLLFVSPTGKRQIHLWFLFAKPWSHVTYIFITWSHIPDLKIYSKVFSCFCSPLVTISTALNTNRRVLTFVASLMMVSTNSTSLPSESPWLSVTYSFTDFLQYRASPHRKRPNFAPLQHVQSATHAICNMCNLQHMQFATH